VGIELLIKFTKSCVVTVLPTTRQTNWSQLELNLHDSRLRESVEGVSEPAGVLGHVSAETEMHSCCNVRKSKPAPDPPRVLSLKERRYTVTFPYVFGRDGLED
jgi:hypothetical protein